MVVLWLDFLHRLVLYARALPCRRAQYHYHAGGLQGTCTRNIFTSSSGTHSPASLHAVPEVLLSFHHLQPTKVVRHSRETQPGAKEPRSGIWMQQLSFVQELCTSPCIFSLEPPEVEVCQGPSTK